MRLREFLRTMVMSESSGEVLIKDIRVFRMSWSLEEHATDLRLVVEKLREHKLCAKLS